VVRFTEHHLYDAVVVENVVEFSKWVLYPAWLAAMHALGYVHQELSLNSAHAQPVGLGAPQLRDRLYVVFTRRGLPVPDLEPYPLSRCTHCSTFVHGVRSWKNGRTIGRYGNRNQYVFTCPNCTHQVEPVTAAAHEALDLSIPGELVADKDLVEKTLVRIQAGLDRHCANGSPDPAVPNGFVMRNNGSPGTGVEHTTSMFEPLRTLTTAGHQSVVLAGGSGEARDATVRMFVPDEVRAGMAFPARYYLGGSIRDQLCQLGNAVTPPSAHHVARRIVAAFLGNNDARLDRAA
jgi:DNA (cytosine-5)-methyltransferase 1